MVGRLLSQLHPRLRLSGPRLTLRINTALSRTHSTLTASPLSTAATTQITTLDNGVRVATENQPGHFLAAGIYVDAGSRYETQQTSGVSHILDRFSFRSTQSMSADMMRQRIETLGGTLNCAASRECMMYQASVFQRDLKPALSLLADTALHPALEEADLEEIRQTVPWELREVRANAPAYYEELLHGVAFGQELLGRSLMCPPDALERMQRDTLLAYRSAWYRPERMVVAVVGAPHDQVVDLASQYFSTYAPGSLSSSAQDPAMGKSTYQGGMVQASDPEQELSHVFIGFRGLGVHDSDVYALATLQVLLGGGGSFSAGGPGKGMYSRLYTRVLSQHYWVEECHAFNQGYTDDGLFGVRAACAPVHAKHLAAVVCAELASLCEPGALREEEVSRARNQLRSSLMMNLESRSIQLEDVGRQVQVLGKRMSAQEMCEHVEAVTPEHLTSIAKRILQGSAPSILMGGKEVEKLGDVSEMVKLFGLGKP
ncbi:LuxS/MPP-like metallohydrolase [Piptocephalis cylindrospora]|uniref:Alpha-MPP n=1 Tax=Piptocephalis cylindrospora TaxID=1907219 RepID=A0A4V1IYP8_9FUNG|nr:LuxS/MPP-like metallohydrolase [Piptocephalis cylindrospora]|eukprot:RKP15309.1 LuxS/MPP-like metallohydrolase [Piptocephalis cylindrospora]